ncbi:MAG: MOSC domain-containing protein [Verrucomicrobiota bacterium]
MNVDIKAIYISPGHDFYGRHGKDRLEHGIEKVDTIECIAGSGLKGDRFFDYKEDFKGQITFFDWAVYERMKEQFGRPDLEPYVFRRNVLTEGVDLNTLIGQRFEVQGILFEGSEESTPCYWMNEAIAPGAEEALKGNGGLRARILTDGFLTTSH